MTRWSHEETKRNRKSVPMKTPKPLTPEEKAAMSELFKRHGVILSEKPKKKPIVVVRQVSRETTPPGARR